ncbi:uncharacterized protein LOC107221441 [Neodiprion lecontei]|uniref:Uncharacterized protein LOC107221441 n=1 Tax=Neodiprion lecontei TaxID=441921 RepID=A0ABM3GM59_NEOLC|nr:uncharacterized protein LOC107221441 [Neodiprion lecontei]
MIGKQLYLAESQMQKMHLLMSKADEQLKEKDQEIGRLKRKVREWEAKFKHQESVHRKELQRERKQVEDSEYLYKRCLVLEHKIYEMEKFLGDYGLMWIGDSESGSDSPRAKSINYLETCYHQLMANIEELNLAAGKGEVHVQREKGGSRASFKTSSCMSLKFYKNGLVVQNGHLRPYEDVATASFIRDILDGYFPSELQQAYPNGVPFKVEDHRTETFQGVGCGFPGHGHRLGKVHPGGNGMALKQGTAPIARIQRQNYCSLTPSVPPLLTMNAKSIKSKSFTEPPSPPDILQLRSQILASHNNNCSDSHIQSHINAELGLSSRSEKKRDMATKDAEYHISLRERGLKFENRFGFGSPRLASGSRTSHHSSTDRSTDRMSPSRLESSRSYDGRSRSRSASLPGKRPRLSSLSNLRTPSGSQNASASKVFDYASLGNGVRKPRATKSATLERKGLAPLLHQVNEPTGKPDEMRLKIRSLNGSTFYLVHLCPDDTVARLYQLLDTCHAKTRLRGYKVVVSGYAPKRLEQLGVSLREYGILRDSVLHVVNDSTM